MLTSTGVNYGVRKGIPHLLGICIGFPIMIILVGLGFGTLFDLYPVIHVIIKWLGITYLLYLAWKIANSRGSSHSTESLKPMTFLQSCAFQWVNPKAWAMGSSALATFTTSGSDFFVQVLLVSFAFFIVSFPSAGVWLVFGASLQRILREPKHLITFNIAMAVLLVLSILPSIFESFA